MVSLSPERLKAMEDCQSHPERFVAEREKMLKNAFTLEEARILLAILDRTWMPTQALNEYRSALTKLKEIAARPENEKPMLLR